MSDALQFNIDRARRLQDRGDVEGAIGILRDALKVLAEEVAASEQRWAGAGGVFDAAYAAKEEFDRLHTDQATVHYALGELLQKLGRKAEARQAFQSVVSLQTDTADSRTLAEKAREALRALGEVGRGAPADELIQRIEADLQSIISSLAEDLTGEAKHELHLLQDWIQDARLPQEVRHWILAVTEDCRHVLMMKGSLGIQEAEDKLRSFYFGLPSRAELEQQGRSLGDELVKLGRQRFRENFDELRTALDKRIERLGKQQETPLHVAAREGNKEAVRRFAAQQGSLLDEKGQGGNTPLFYAAGRGHEAIVALLLDGGADPQVRNHAGETALHAAAQCGRARIMQLLLERGTDVNAEAYNGATPLHLASASGNVDAVRFLLERGADVGTRTTNGGTALHRAAERGHDGVARLLLERGAEVSLVEATQVNDRTALHWAARTGNETLVRLLLDHGADMDIGAGTGRAPLHEAVLTQHAPVVRLLVERGADINAKDEKGRTSLDIAHEKGYADIENRLKNGTSQ